MNAHDLSIWLTPSGTLHDQLVHTIAHLSATLKGPAFPPHMTLLSHIDAEPHDVTERVRRCSAHIQPFTVTLHEFNWSDHYFRAFFIAAHLHEPLVQARLRLAQSLQLAPSADFAPHLSLMYGHYSKAQKIKLREAIDLDLPLGMLVHHMDVYATQGPPARWHRLERIMLGEH